MRRSFVQFIGFTTAVLFLAACSSSKAPLTEQAATTQTAPAEQPQPQQTKQPSALPELKAVETAVKRVFKDAAVIDASHQPAFVAGDFNGDQSQDIAVVLKPSAERIADLNEEYPGWILRNPLGRSEPATPRLKVAANDVLLAVIHGYGPEGWRDPQATQTYLLKNSAGSEMQPRSAKDVVTESNGQKSPQLQGDVIAQVIQNQHGYLYFSMSTYNWYDPKSFTTAPGPRRGHGAAARRTN